MSTPCASRVILISRMRQRQSDTLTWASGSSCDQGRGREAARDDVGRPSLSRAASAWSAIAARRSGVTWSLCGARSSRSRTPPSSRWRARRRFRRAGAAADGAPVEARCEVRAGRRASRQPCRDRHAHTPRGAPRHVRREGRHAACSCGPPRCAARSGCACIARAHWRRRQVREPCVKPPSRLPGAAQGGTRRDLAPRRTRCGRMRLRRDRSRAPRLDLVAEACQDGKPYSRAMTECRASRRSDFAWCFKCWRIGRSGRWP